MTPRLNGFDTVAGVYDSLARLVFGDLLSKAQIAYLHEVKPRSCVLILGGGTGTIAERLLEMQPDCEVTYLDASLGMLKRAQKRLGHQRNIHFIHGTEASIPVVQFDTVITPFYLDMFPNDRLAQVIPHISSHLTNSGQWIAADFCSSKKLWHWIQLSIMYAFFRATTGIEAKSLPDWNAALVKHGWTKTDSVLINGFIEGALFKRAG